MDQSTRNTLRNVVTQCRRLLEESVAQVLQGQFGIYATGKKDEVQIESEARMSHLSEEDQAYRQDLLDHYEHIKALGYKAKDALAQLIREVAFTHLNRFCAYRMMESRGLIRESVSKGLKSQGFLFYLADHEEDERRFNTGQQDIAYRHFLNWLGGTLSEEIGVLFAPTDPANRLYPPQRVIDQVLSLINDPDLAGIWSEDEAIGWVYQYFTPKELRDQARKESQAPRNSYELAFRNQFFTPRYVVEFLTDNTLGRIWYEMRQGDTRLKDQCRYMVRRPTEVFLRDGEAEPEDVAKATDDLTQEELLKLPVYVPFRVKKDPRELRILDPACGSGHFLLYCFDLLLTIYEEAYGDAELGSALKKDYATKEDLQRDVPRLILAHNLHGIDIDPRASQIAALALWLRCQRVYQEMGIKQDRPQITRSNIVCAEPMPGEEQMLKEFVAQLEPRFLGQVVEVVFDKMKLAGEAGSLLQIEEDIRETVAAARKQYTRETTHATDRKGRELLFSEAEMGRLANGPTQESLFDVSGITETAFFEHAEKRVVEALRTYAEQAQTRHRLSRSLFSEDVVRGFAFVESCRNRYDVVLMNPPFGLPSKPIKRLLRRSFPETWKDMYAAFAERALSLLNTPGLLGAITPSMWQYSRQLKRFRGSLLAAGSPRLLVEIGHGVMDDATVEAGLWVAARRKSIGALAMLDLLGHPPDTRAASILGRFPPWRLITPRSFSHIEEAPLCHHMSDEYLALWRSEGARLRRCVQIAKGNTTFDDFRFLRLWTEVPQSDLGNRWLRYRSGGDFQPYYASSVLCLDWRDNGAAVRDFGTNKHGSDAQVMQSSKLWRLAGLSYPRVGTLGFGVRAAQANEVFSGSAVFLHPKRPDHLFGLLAFLNSSVVLELMKAHGRHRRTETIAIKDLPLSEDVLDALSVQCGGDAQIAANAMRAIESYDELSPVFSAVGIQRGLDVVQSEVDALLATVNACSHRITATVANILSLNGDQLPPPDSVYFKKTCSPPDVAYRHVSACLGVVFGRFNADVLAGVLHPPTPADIFAALPDISPAMAGRVNAEASATPAGNWEGDRDGVLVDDPSHDDDITSLLQAVFRRVWGTAADDKEAEICNALRASTLRECLRKSTKGGFWTDHLTRYSSNRRRAPIYWLIQSSKKNYAIWLYYHRLDKDILFKALVNYVEPKIRLEKDRLESLRSQKGADGTGKATKKLDKEIEKQEDFLSELRDFEEKLRRAAELRFDPDLNDGVVLNIAPLHELVPWKEARSYWEELLEGKYEWSSIGKQLRQKGLVT